MQPFIVAIGWLRAQVNDFPGQFPHIDRGQFRVDGVVFFSPLGFCSAGEGLLAPVQSLGGFGGTTDGGLRFPGKFLPAWKQLQQA